MLLIVRQFAMKRSTFAKVLKSRHLNMVEGSYRLLLSTGKPSIEIINAGTLQKDEPPLIEIVNTEKRLENAKKDDKYDTLNFNNPMIEIVNLSPKPNQPLIEVVNAGGKLKTVKEDRKDNSMTPNEPIIEIINKDKNVTSNKPLMEIVNLESATRYENAAEPVSKKPLVNIPNADEGSSMVEQALLYLQSITLADLLEKKNLQRKALDKVLKKILKKQIPCFEKEDEVRSLLKKLLEAEHYADKYAGTEKLIEKILNELKLHPAIIKDEMKVELLSLIMRLRYYYKERQEPQQALGSVIKGINLAIISENFSIYADFFYTLAMLRFNWNGLPYDQRRELLSSMKKFGDIEQLSLDKAEKFVHAMNNLLVVKDYLQEMNEEVKEYYEQLMNKVLKEMYEGGGEGRGENLTKEKEDKELGVAAAILSQLVSLAASKKQVGLSSQQLELIYKGLQKEWNFESMGVYQQCLVIFMLGELSVDFRTLPEGLWQHMMDGLIKKISVDQWIKPKSLSALLTGLKEMRVTWKELDVKVQKALMKCVLRASEDPKDFEAIPNTIYRLSFLEVDWEKDVNRKNELYERMKSSAREFNFIDVNLLLHGLLSMNIHWVEVPLDVRSSLAEAIERNFAKFEPEEMILAFYSRVQMEIPWKTTSKDKTIQNSVSTDAPETSISPLSSPASSEKVPMELRSKIRKTFGSLSSENVIKIVTRLGMLKGSSLDAFTITTTPQNIHSKQGLGNLFKCITLLDIKWYYLSEESQATLANLIASSSWQLNRKELCDWMFQLMTMMKQSEKDMKKMKKSEKNDFEEKVYGKDSFYQLHRALLHRYRYFHVFDKTTTFSDEDEINSQAYIKWIKTELSGKVTQKLFQYLEEDMKRRR